MNTTRRQFVAAVGTGIGLAAASHAAGPTAVSTKQPLLPIRIDRGTRTLHFLAPVNKAQLRGFLHQEELPHRWLQPDSLELRSWTIATPQLARGFGWRTVDAGGAVLEAWAELHIESFEPREFEVSVDEQRHHTTDGVLHFRCERFPRVQLHDRTGRNRRCDHLHLLAGEGQPSRVHRLVAVA